MGAGYHRVKFKKDSGCGGKRKRFESLELFGALYYGAIFKSGGKIQTSGHGQ